GADLWEEVKMAEGSRSKRIQQSALPCQFIIHHPESTDLNMDDPVPFGSRAYFLMLAVLACARAADFLSTWIATPNLELEGNPLARKLGWKWGSLINTILVALL